MLLFKKFYTIVDAIIFEVYILNDGLLLREKDERDVLSPFHNRCHIDRE